MKNDLSNDTSTGKEARGKPVPDDVAADPVAVVLMLQQEAETSQAQDSIVARSFEQAEIKERVLRRILEASLDRSFPDNRPNLKIIK